MPEKKTATLSIQFGRNISRLREMRKMTQEQLAEAASVSSRYLQELEAGKGTNPSLRVIHSLRRALDCSWPELLDTTSG